MGKSLRRLFSVTGAATVLSGVLVLTGAAGMGALQPAEPPPEPIDSAEPVDRPDATPLAGERADAGPREVVLSMKGGREVTGVLVRETDEMYYLRIESIDLGFAKSDVTGVRELPPVLERYVTMRSLLEDDDLDGRVLLVQWLRARELYRLALDEVTAVLELDPYHARARELKTWLELQVNLTNRDKAEEAPGGATIDAKEAFLARQKAKREFPLLTPEQINLIKVYEVDLRDAPPLLIRRETIDQLIRMFPESPLIPATPEGRDALYRRPPEQILELMFRLQARELYGQVVVRGHPRAIERFRNDVHGKWLLNSCATAQCHGGQEAGRLWLYTNKQFSDETVYTNLFILDRFELDDGTPLLNFSEPARSPLLQMALPEELSLYPHPSAERTKGSRGWRAVFRSSEDKRFQEAVAWLSDMYRPRPEYPIEYEAARPLKPEKQPSEPEPDR